MNALIAAIDRAHASAKYVSFTDSELAALKRALETDFAWRVTYGASPQSMAECERLLREVSRVIDARPSMLVRS